MTATLGRRPAIECRPRYMTPRTPDRPTLGPRVAEIAAALGKPFLPWQREAADVAYELDPETGYLVYSECDLIVMRQNGKSELLFPVMTHRSLGFDRSLTRWLNAQYGTDLQPPGAQRTMYLAQTADKARAKWRDIHVARIRESALSPLLIDARLRQNQEMMTWTNGSTWVPAAATKKDGGTGDSLDCGVIDEAWAHEPSTELGLRPTMLTRPWRQLWIASMIPGPRRRAPGTYPYLMSKIKRGRARVEAGMRSGVFYLEFSAREGMDPKDPATWWSCMPALGRTIPERAVLEDFDELGLADFEAEYLGWEPKVGTPRWLVIGETAWKDRGDPGSSAEDPVACGVETNADLSTTTISIAGLRGGSRDRVHVEVVERLPGIEWAVKRTCEVVESWSVCAIAIDPAGAASALIDPIRRELDERGIDCPVLKPNSREVAAGHSRFLMACGVETADVVESAAGDGPDLPVPPVRRRLSHLGQPELDRSVASAEKGYTGSLWRFVEAMPGADMSPIRSVALALYAGDGVDWEGATYDIASSLG